MESQRVRRNLTIEQQSVKFCSPAVESWEPLNGFMWEDEMLIKLNLNIILTQWGDQKNSEWLKSRQIMMTA